MQMGGRSQRSTVEAGIMAFPHHGCLHQVAGQTLRGACICGLACQSWRGATGVQGHLCYLDLQVLRPSCGWDANISVMRRAVLLHRIGCWLSCYSSANLKTLCHCFRVDARTSHRIRQLRRPSAKHLCRMWSCRCETWRDFTNLPHSVSPCCCASHLSANAANNACCFF